MGESNAVEREVRLKSRSAGYEAEARELGGKAAHLREYQGDREVIARLERRQVIALRRAARLRLMAFEPWPEP